jgi:hypothetical protein
MSKQLSSVGIQMPAQRSLIGRSMSTPPPVFNAQQYSSATFASLRFYRRKEKFSARFRNGIISVFYFFFSNRVHLKLR